MGFSKMHSTKVGLVLNLLTGSISPQFHVVFDDMFSTVMKLNLLICFRTKVAEDWSENS